LTVFIVTHDLDTIYTMTDRVAVLAQKRVLINDTLAAVAAADDAWIREYFHGPRGRAAADAAQTVLAALNTELNPEQT
ncbi:MAG TPA: ABC transporter ATP-binding protein, partial [Thauera sp.]|nr:ABC transporter ATP-binding protein [Thauera sp.]